jgi:3-isopropylmalate/(R)-2-methylmalate dehydratase large subunit
MIQPDLVIAHEFFIYPQTVMAMEELGIERIWDPDRTMVVFDHATPAPNTKWAKKHAEARRWVRKQGIKHFYDIGYGISHQIAAELGLVRPGMFVANGDPHVTAYGALGAFAPAIGSQTQLELILTGETWYQVPETIHFIIQGQLPLGVTARDVFTGVMNEIGLDGALEKAMWFDGPAIAQMDMDQRMTLCDLAPLAGASNAIVAADDVTADYLADRTSEPWLSIEPAGTPASSQMEYNLEGLAPLVNRPPDPVTAVPVTEVEPRPINQGSIGSCAGGRMDEMRIAAQVLRNRQITSGVRLIVTPASREVQSTLIKEGLAETFIAAGASLESPGCGTCMGFKGALDDGEVCVANSTQNIQGRMGSLSADIYLANAAVVAASCVEGRIADPRPYLNPG